METARLAARVAARKGSFGPYLSVTIGEAEEDASSIQQTFDSIQPPNRKADELRRDLDDLLTEVVSSLADLRIAVRRGELSRLPEAAQPLDEQSQKLDDFQEAHSG